MRYLLSILLIFCFFKGFAQPVSYRSNNQITVQDANLFAGFSLKMPAFKDTVAANSAYTLDSCGKLIYTYTGNKVYYRACGPKRWIEVTNGSTAGNFIDSLRYRSDSVYGKKNGQFIFQYRDSTASLIDSIRYKSDSVFAKKKNGQFVFQYRDSTSNLIDSIKYSNDSVFAKKKNGQFVFQYIDSSAFLTFQDVLDNGSVLNKNNTILTNGRRFIIDNNNNLNPISKSTFVVDTTISGLSVGNTVDTTAELFLNLSNRANINSSFILRKGPFTSSLFMEGDSLTLQAGTNTNSSKIIMDSAGITFSPALPTPPPGVPSVTASGTDTYTATISGVTSYSDGDAYIIKFLNGNTGTSTLNINGLGARTLYRNNDGRLIGGDIHSGAEMLVVYDSTSPAKFQCIGTSPNSLFAYVTNGESITINKGQPVYAFGGTGDRMVVKLASNKTDSTSAQTVGLALNSIAAGQKGFIIIQGQLDNLSILPTSTFADGDAIYLDSIAGGITKTKPIAPYHLVYLGVVTTASNGNAGRMYVRVQNGYEFSELHDVQITNPQNNQIIAYSDTVPKLWKNRNIYSIVDTVNTISTKYRVDTMRTNIYNQLAQEVNVADTANMLRNYQRTSSFPVATFGAGSGAAGDTSAFSTTALYGSFYLNAGADTIIITGYTGVVQGTSASVTPTIWFNDSLNVTAGGTRVVNSPAAVTSTTTGNTVTSLDNTKIPPGNFVWVTTGTVTTKPTYFNLTLIGYRKRP